MLYTSCKLGLADAMASEGVALPDLAVATKSNDKNLFRLLRALAQQGYFQMDSGGAWWNTHLSSVLRSDHPNAMCPIIAHNVEDVWQASTSL